MINLFVGIDPGFTGAIGVMTVTGTCYAVDMPVHKLGAGDGHNAIDIKALIEYLRKWDGAKFGLENPTTRPGEGAERSFRFGRGVGNIEAVLTTLGQSLMLISPNTWTSKLGFPGKQYDNAVDIRERWLLDNYPLTEGLLRGPRGGLLDGRIDALCIAAYLKQISGGLGKWGGRRPPKFLGGGFKV